MGDNTRGRSIMVKRQKQKKLPKRTKLRRGNSATRGKARKVSKSARGKSTKRPVVEAISKPAIEKKAARKEVRRMKRPAASAVETTVIDVTEKPAPGVITVTEFEETVVREENPGPG
jgi:hypothetical protein